MSYSPKAHFSIFFLPTTYDDMLVYPINAQENAKSVWIGCPWNKHFITKEYQPSTIEQVGRLLIGAPIGAFVRTLLVIIWLTKTIFTILFVSSIQKMRGRSITVPPAHILLYLRYLVHFTLGIIPVLSIPLVYGWDKLTHLRSESLHIS